METVMIMWGRVLIRSLLAVLIGSLIGSERARHGRAAGMRTHILVCLGAALTSMTSMYVADVLGHEGDVFRISAQVISGVSFLGAGMIILKSNNIITGLTTAAGIWATGAIGVAVGYGFYAGAVIGTILFLSTIMLFAKVGRKKDSAEVLYLEVDDMYQTNKIMKQIEQVIEEPFTYQVIEPKSKCSGHLGIYLVIEKRVELDVAGLCAIENVVFAIED